ncbi:LysR family transcriptional regulator [Parahaliea mediterranea]|uniref:LysR family transcriptional regulator n=1 Tax=Parahaliea mediterranea TaxID=651086 RepID=A0A939DGR3_9GAMM|nr:LysR family transcriptional regulator [Parahaliea mediterranea]MBN7797815.1 LysR family transcriptional regulator [Parahaliea mediterranea]
MVTLKQLSHLKAIMQHGTVHSAAESLHLTQSALTRSLNSLEETLGVQLFNRSKRGMTPTAFCLSIAERCQNVLLDIEDIKREANLYRNLQKGELNIAFGRAVKELLTRNTLPAFHASFPQIAMTISEGTPSELIYRLKQRQIDFVLAGLGSYREFEGIRGEPMKPIPLVAITRPGHPLRHYKNLTFHHMLEYPLILPTVVNLSNPLLSALQEAAPSRTITPQIVCSDNATLAEVLLRGDCWLIAPRMSFDAELRSGKLSKLDVTHPAFFIDLHVLELNGRSRTPAAQSFIDICQDFLRQVDSDA